MATPPQHVFVSKAELTRIFEEQGWSEELKKFRREPIYDTERYTPDFKKHRQGFKFYGDDQLQAVIFYYEEEGKPTIVAIRMLLIGNIRHCAEP